MNTIQRIIFLFRARLAVRKAVRLNRADGRRYMVLNIQGRPRLIAQQNVRTLIRRHVFRKGITIADIRRRALFITK